MARYARSFPSTAPLEDSISVSLILQCSRARTKGTRAENTNYNDTRPPPRKQTRCPCINLSVFSEGTSGQDEDISFEICFSTVYPENGNVETLLFGLDGAWRNSFSDCIKNLAIQIEEVEEVK